jgi:hypothetical protein
LLAQDDNFIAIPGTKKVNSLADRLGVLELVVWDKDYLGKDYLGEADLPLDDWFTSPSPVDD